METPTLNKKQQKSSLSAKKVRSKETIKNVLASPYSQYWPLIPPEDYIVLKQILEQNLPKITEKVRVPWRDIKNIPKADRKKFKEDYRKNNKGEISKNNRRGVVIGVNNVTKLLEENKMSVILITDDVNPKIMVQHVIDQAVLYSIPVIIFNGLRKLLKEICGTGSVVLGISKDSNLNLITEAVAQCFEKCPPPVNHINYNRSVDSEVEIINVDKNFEPERVENKIYEDEIRQTVYLKREDKSKRVFIPVYKEKVSRNDIMEVDSEGFLPFSQEQVSKDVNTKKPSYKSLIVKRLRSDPKRNKKKIDTLKRKRKSQ